jgi:hypothetical protein
LGAPLENEYVVVPGGKEELVTPVPKVSVKIGLPEFPLQNPNCA